MLFNSYIFLLFFLPVTLLLYFGCNYRGEERLAEIVLIGMSLFFYAYFHVSYLFLILGSILFNYGCSRFLIRLGRREQTLLPSGVRRGGRINELTASRIVLTLGILVNTGIIFYFKYFNFFMENWNRVFHTSHVFREILMPLGISFFTFQQISYLVDSYRGETKNYDFVDYALFVTFFPQLIAGPIVLHQEMIPQFHDPGRKRLDHERLSRGLWLLAAGLAKKVLIADTLGRGADWGYQYAEFLGGFETFVVSVLYCLQIYFDFSGYCDMASGIASMFGFDLPLNFNSPYKSTSISEFWQRWHMSLSRFLQKYIYFPLGGNRKGFARTMINLMIVFLISGIWHGADWTFILWGALHGGASILFRIFEKIWKKLPWLVRWFINFLFIDFTWILFRADNMEQAGMMFRNLLKPWHLNIQGGLLEQFDLLEFTYVEDHIGILGNIAAAYPALHLAIIMAGCLFIALVPRNCQEKEFKPTAGNGLLCILLLVWSVISFSGISTFLYFNF